MLNGLIGCECEVDFNRTLMPNVPFSCYGYPIRVRVEDVDMPMIKMRHIGDLTGHSDQWLNASCILNIKEL